MNFLELGKTPGIGDQTNSKSLNMQPIQKIENKSPIPTMQNSQTMKPPGNWQMNTSMPALPSPKHVLPHTGNQTSTAKTANSIVYVIDRINEKRAYLRGKLAILNILRKNVSNKTI